MASEPAPPKDPFLGDPWRGCNPLDPAYLDDPYPRLRALREREPVAQTPAGFWRVTRYADLVKLLKHVPAGVRRTDGTLPYGGEAPGGAGDFMLEQDPPEHTRLRRLVASAFTPRAVRALQPTIERVAGECVDAALAKGELDVIADLALPVPATLICEMLGVPIEDRDLFTVWTADATHGLAGPLAPPDVIERAREAGDALYGYFNDLIAKRRVDLRDDILSGLIRAEAEGDRLSPAELISQATGLLIAGFETTIGLIGNGVRQLILHPGELAKLRERPGLIASAVEECLRFDGPITLTSRILHSDAEFGGFTIPVDTEVWAMIAAANRDPEVFEDPERFYVERSPNEHFAFGGGTHFCLGAHLARMEAQIAIGTLVQRTRSLELVNETVEWGRSLFRVPGTLPVTFTPA